MSRFVATATSVYARLLRFCPYELRAEFGDEMALVFADDLTDSLARGGPAAAFRVCFRSAAELARLGVSNALAIRGVLTSLIVSVLTMICFSFELALARISSPAGTDVAPVGILMIAAMIPSIAAAIIAFIAARLGLRSTPQRFLN